ncbi:MAG: hypothetical protein IKI11_00075 [Neisseriaceae bacterium]|nr:hypothetical protein [Neisseriaceae bacterium]
MPSIVTHSPQEISTLYGQLSKEQQQDIYSSLINMLNLNINKSHSNQTITLFDYFKNGNPAWADIDLEITPRSEQKSRRDSEL